MDSLAKTEATVPDKECPDKMGAELSASQPLSISLAYAPVATCQYYEHLTVAAGTTLYEALDQAGWLERFDDLARWCESVQRLESPSAKLWHVGVYSKKQALNYVLKPYDRIEVYRSLRLDPMKTRKKRATQKQQG